MPKRKPKKGDILSRREKQLAHYITEGLSNQEIAEILNIKEKTVKFHNTSIFAKVGVNSRSQFIVQYYRAIQKISK